MSTKLDAKLQLYVPPLEDLAKTLQDGLGENFQTVQVNIIDCPDLTEKPFCLAAKGLGGSARIVDVGGAAFLLPIIKKDKLYKLQQVCQTSDLPNAFALGPAAGPSHLLGFNSEMVLNAHLLEDSRSVFRSYVVHMEKTSIAPYSVKMLDDGKACEFELTANLLLSEGKTDKVLKIVAKSRTGKENFIACMRLAVAKKYRTSPVGLGGAFLLKKGRANVHIIPPDWPDKFANESEIHDWLNYFEVDSPLVCASVFVSHDLGCDVRTEHTHCFSSDEKRGGHYEYDTTALEVEYEGYFTPAEVLYRIDRP